MSKKDYAAFDAKILELIAQGVNKFGQISVVPEIITLAAPLQGFAPVWRVVDRRLQALRGQEKIRFNGFGWELRAPTTRV